ncbi:MAG: hypothetical protein ACM3PF_11045 [Bacteroidota bacterium]
MGKGTDGVKASPEELEQNVREIRNEMAPVLNELDHRRHEMTDWKLQLRRRAPVLLKGAAVLAALVAGFTFVKRRRARSRAKAAAAA